MTTLVPQDATAGMEVEMMLYMARSFNGEPITWQEYGGRMGRCVSLGGGRWVHFLTEEITQAD